MSDDSCWYRSGSDPTICDAEVNDELICQPASEVADLKVNNIGTVDLDVQIEAEGEIVFEMVLAALTSDMVDVLPGQPWSWVATYNGRFIDGQDGEGSPCLEIAELVYNIDSDCDMTLGSVLILSNDSPPEFSVGFQVEVEGEEPFNIELLPGFSPHTLSVPDHVPYSWQVEYQGFPVEQSVDPRPLTDDCSA